MMRKGASNILAAVLAAASGAAASAATTVVTADRMLDVMSGKMVERPAIVVVDGRIRQDRKSTRLNSSHSS